MIHSALCPRRMTLMGCINRPSCLLTLFGFGLWQTLVGNRRARINRSQGIYFSGSFPITPQVLAGGHRWFLVFSTKGIFPRASTYFRCRFLPSPLFSFSAQDNATHPQFLKVVVSSLNSSQLFYLGVSSISCWDPE